MSEATAHGTGPSRPQGFVPLPENEVPNEGGDRQNEDDDKEEAK
jgi:hypothetical protein